MYRHRELTPDQTLAIVSERFSRGFPAHSPPHQVRVSGTYLLTAACYEHACHMSSAARRSELLAQLAEGMALIAWVVLPNHYHLLAEVADIAATGRALGRIHGALSRRWNAEDGTPGRRVWYRYTDRAIRSERHYYTALNYLHYNPVKHGWVKSPNEWAESSLGEYLAAFGREGLKVVD